jgi:hypothetical protein
MRSANCSPISHPMLPPTHQHHMWYCTKYLFSQPCSVFTYPFITVSLRFNAGMHGIWLLKFASLSFHLWSRIQMQNSRCVPLWYYAPIKWHEISSATIVMSFWKTEFLYLFFILLPFVHPKHKNLMCLSNMPFFLFSRVLFLLNNWRLLRCGWTMDLNIRSHPSSCLLFFRCVPLSSC